MNPLEAESAAAFEFQGSVLAARHWWMAPLFRTQLPTIRQYGCHWRSKLVCRDLSQRGVIHCLKGQDRNS